MIFTSTSVRPLDITSHNIFVGKVTTYGLDKCAVRSLENWLQRVVIRGTKSSWRQVTSAVCQGSIQGPKLFTIFVNDLDDERECTFNKHTGDTKREGVADRSDSCAAIQRDPDRLESWADRNLIFDKRKCKFLYWLSWWTAS